MRYRFLHVLLSVAVIAASLSASGARADYLEVRRTAHVRQEPSNGEPEITVVQPGEKLTLLDDGAQVDGWYHVELASGDDGWVYRTLVRRFPGSFDPPHHSRAPPMQPASADDRFRIEPSANTNRTAELTIGSWNIKWFGQKKPDEYDFDALSDFVEECDLVAIQELRGAYARDCMDALIARLRDRGHTFTYVISLATGYNGNSDATKKDYVESFAFCWRPARLKLRVPAKLASTPYMNHPIFRQVPFVGDFEVVGGRGFDFRILTTHTVYNASINHVRSAEIRWISDWLTTTGSSDGEQELVAIGDFNANPKGQPADFSDIIPDGSLFRVLMYESLTAGEPSVRTTPALKTSSTDPSYFLQPVYDHVLITKATSHALPANPMNRTNGFMGVWAFDQDPVWRNQGLDTPTVVSRVSDHRPIWFKMNFEAEDLDPDP